MTTTEYRSIPDADDIDEGINMRTVRAAIPKGKDYGVVRIREGEEVPQVGQALGTVRAYAYYDDLEDVCERMCNSVASIQNAGETGHIAIVVGDREDDEEYGYMGYAMIENAVCTAIWEVI